MAATAGIAGIEVQAAGLSKREFQEPCRGLMNAPCGSSHNAAFRGFKANASPARRELPKLVVVSLLPERMQQTPAPVSANGQTAVTPQTPPSEQSANACFGSTTEQERLGKSAFGRSTWRLQLGSC